MYESVASTHRLSRTSPIFLRTEEIRLDRHLVLELEEPLRPLGLTVEELADPIGQRIEPEDRDAEDPGLSVRISLPDPKTASSWTADFSITSDQARNLKTMSLNAAAVDCGELGVLLDRWHTVGLVLRRGTSTAALWLDGRPVLDGVPLVQGAWAGPSPDIIVRSTGTKAVRVEDLEARYKDRILKPEIEGEDVSQRLVKDSFEGYPTGVFPAQGGWRTGVAQALGLVQDSRLEAGQGAAVLPNIVQPQSR